VAVALIEAKAEHLPPGHGLEQAKLYARCERLNVPFVFSSNGHLFIEFDRASGQTGPPRPLEEFPAPSDLRARYEQAMGFRLDDESAKPLLTRYVGGEATRRYYQDAAIRAVLEKLVRGERRALLSLATGAGKTFIAVNLLRRIADAGQLQRALFVCDRDELRNQGLAAFQGVFGAESAPVSGGIMFLKEIGFQTPDVVQLGRGDPFGSELLEQSARNPSAAGFLFPALKVLFGSPFSPLDP